MSRQRHEPLALLADTTWTSVRDWEEDYYALCRRLLAGLDISEGALRNAPPDALRRLGLTLERLSRLPELHDATRRRLQMQLGLVRGRLSDIAPGGVTPWLPGGTVHRADWIEPAWRIAGAPNMSEFVVRVRDAARADSAPGRHP